MRPRNSILVGVVYFVSLLTLSLSAFGQGTKPPATAPAKKDDDKTVKEAAAKKTPPLSLKDVQQMLGKRMTPDDVLGKALERGIDFEITKATQLQLSKAGFNDVQLEGLKTCLGIEPLPPIVPGRHLTTSEKSRDQHFENIQKITKDSVKDAAMVQTDHFTLWAPKEIQAVVLPDLKKLEALFETKFQEPIRSGLDKRTTHIVLIKSPKECEKWVSTHYDVMNVKTDDPGGKTAYVKLYAVGFSDDDTSVKCLEGIQPMGLRREVIAEVGYMTMAQMCDLKSPAPLETGFCNGAEKALFGTAITPFVSQTYATGDRKIGDDNRAWLTIVKTRLATKSVTPPGELLELDTTKMKLPHYAEAWTLVDLLARDRVKFGKLVFELRSESSGLKAIETVYGWNENKLTEEWHKHINGM